MKRPGRRLVENGAPMALEVVADLIGHPDPADVAGYICIGLMNAGDFAISSNASSDAAEIALLECVLVVLKADLAEASDV